MREGSQRDESIDDEKLMNSVAFIGEMRYDEGADRFQFEEFAVIRHTPICIALLAFASVAHADNWPQWRGPTNDGISRDSNVPTEWSESKNIAWKLKMPGMAGSTPCVWGDRIFVTSEDGSDVALMCIGTDGKEIWKRPYGASTGKRYMRGEGNEASASPSTDGKHVWVFDGSGDFACFDFDGNQTWKFDAQERYGKFSIQHGMHITPLLDGDRLYFALLHSNAWVVVALDKATGKEIWKIKRNSDAYAENEHSYASVSIWRKNGDAYLVVHGNDYTTAHSLDDGKELWRLGDLNPTSRYNQTLRFVASPVVSENLIVVPTAKNGPVVAVKPEARGEIKAGSPGELWRREKGTPDVPCPLIHNGLVYLNRERDNLVCVDAATGKENYNQQIHRGLYRASPVFADGKIYVTCRDGTVTVVKAGPTFELLAENKLPDQISASPAIANGRIYLRGWNYLYAIGPNGN
jgi:outer membrane protein assembly factor BamB